MIEIMVIILIGFCVGYTLVSLVLNKPGPPTACV